MDILYLGGLKPTVSTIDCEGRSFTVNAYPADKRSVKLKFDAINAVKWKIELALKQYLPDIGFDTPSGAFAFENQWKECPINNKVNWTFTVDAGWDPLFGIHAEFPFGPGAAIPKALKKYVDMTFYVKFNGKLTLVGKHGRDEYAQYTGKTELGGSIGGGVGARFVLMNPKAVSAQLEGGTAITAKGNVIVATDGLCLDNAVVNWDGVTAKVTVYALYGKIEFKDSWEVVKPVEMWKGNLKLVSW